MRLNLEEPWALEADKFRLKLAFDCWQGQKDIDVEGWGCWGDVAVTRWSNGFDWQLFIYHFMGWKPGPLGFLLFFVPAGGSFDVAGLVGAKYRHCSKFCGIRTNATRLHIPTQINTALK